MEIANPWVLLSCYHAQTTPAHCIEPKLRQHYAAVRPAAGVDQD